jgi:uncharacterized protein
LGIVEFAGVLAPVTAWARSRADVIGLALVGSWARAAARDDSDIDLMLLVSSPQIFRADESWLSEIHWSGRSLSGWHDADYGAAWSRHVKLAPLCNVEFTFCESSWAAIDPVDSGTLDVVSGGCRILVDKAGLFGRLLAVTSP